MCAVAPTAVLQKSTAATPPSAARQTHQVRRARAQRLQTTTRPRVCRQEVRGSTPRVSTQVRGPSRSSGRASANLSHRQVLVLVVPQPLIHLLLDAHQGIWCDITHKPFGLFRCWLSNSPRPKEEWRVLVRAAEVPADGVWRLKKRATPYRFFLAGFDVVSRVRALGIFRFRVLCDSSNGEPDAFEDDQIREAA